MTEEATKARLSRIENDLAEVRKERREDIHSLHKKMDSVIATVAALSGSHGMDNVRIRGELDALTPRLEQLEDKCSTMHDMLQQAKGGGKVIAGIYGAIGASVLSGVVWLVTHLLTTGKP